jgi:hypothetical protein
LVSVFPASEKFDSNLELDAQNPCPPTTHGYGHRLCRGGRFVRLEAGAQLRVSRLGRRRLQAATWRQVGVMQRHRRGGGGDLTFSVNLQCRCLRRFVGVHQQEDGACAGYFEVRFGGVVFVHFGFLTSFLCLCGAACDCSCFVLRLCNFVLKYCHLALLHCLGLIQIPDGVVELGIEFRP